ncbi:MAG: hypothetical protein M0024_03230 [Nitrospiraceae bacterium]|nr:hypothetical protein [Nitrospiraceae bacterium]
MGYAVAQLGEKEGFDKKISFASTMDEKAVAAAYEAFAKTCSGVRKDHLPLRCPIRRSAETGLYELQFDDRNLSYNFDTLMNFISQVISEGMVRAAKILDNGKIGGTAYVVTPNIAKKFEFFPKEDTLRKISDGTLTYAEILTSADGITLSAYLKSL